MATILGLVPAAAGAQANPAVELRAVRAAVAPKLDGVLDDAAWAGDPLPADHWVSYSPLRGEPAQQRTQVWIVYDDKAIYFAFRCLDPEPARIRSTISRRDNVWNDDWVAVSLDSNRAGQVAYHMFVNPSGIQMDALNSGANGEDTAPDWTWQSAGHIDERGYAVEMRVPLQSIRFKSGPDVTMGVMFFRRNSRLGLSWAWPEMAPGKWVFETHVPVVFGELRQPRLLEVLPSQTVAVNATRDANGAWQDSEVEGDLGVSVKYGLTSAITVDATVNPDFSQVESDAFEVEVNQRFPIFFSEKRPFFMEGLGLFNLAGTGGDSTMRTAVHTRRIIDPSAGVKLTGSSGQHTFALLSTADASTEGDLQRKFTIARGIRNLGQGQYVGALVTDTEYGVEHNRVAAFDASLRRGDHFSWNGTFLYSDSADAEHGHRNGVGSQATYSYTTRRLTVVGQGEHYGRDFQMGTAFINRVGVTRGWQYQEVQFYPDEKKHGWIKRIAPFLWLTGARDRAQAGNDRFLLPGIRFSFIRQGYLRLDYGRGREAFAGRQFTVGRAHIDGGAQFTRWLNVGGSIDSGPGIFYEDVDSFAGTQLSRSVRLGLQPSARLNHSLSYNYVRFDRTNGERVFALHVANLRTTYQFSPRFLVRAIAQVDSGERRILGDLLASYELSPGTVVHAGYGSIFDQSLSRDYQARDRAIFFKASYLARF